MLILPTTVLHGSRTFASASSQYLVANRNPVTAAPYTFGGWYLPTAIAANQVLFGLADSGSSNNLIELYYANAFPGLRLFTQNAAGSFGQSGLAGEGTLTAGTWVHVLGRSKSASDRNAAKNGVFGTADTTAITPTAANLNAVYFGVQRTGGAFSGYANGTMAGWGLWNADLSDAEVLLLAKGYSPLVIRPDSLVAYWPFAAGSLFDAVGPSHLTNVGTTPNLVLPPGFMAPVTQRRIYFNSVAGGGSVALTGLSVAASGGTLVPNLSTTLTGQAVTASGGTLVPNLSIALTGLSMTASGGTLGLSGNVTVALTGLSITTALGTFTPNLTTGLAGLSVTASRGSLAVSTSIALAGLQATASYGTLTPSGGDVVHSVWTNVTGTSTIWTNQSGTSTTWTNQ